MFCNVFLSVDTVIQINVYSRGEKHEEPGEPLVDKKNKWLIVLNSIFLASGQTEAWYLYRCCIYDKTKIINRCERSNKRSFEYYELSEHMPECKSLSNMSNLSNWFKCNNRDDRDNWNVYFSGWDQLVKMSAKSSTLKQSMLTNIRSWNYIPYFHIICVGI